MILSNRNYTLILTCKHIFAILMITSVFFASCEKGESGGNTNESLNEGLYPMLFSPGSYWIYESSINGDLDSLFLTDIIDDKVVIVTGKGYTSTFEAYKLTYLGQNSGWYNEYLFGYVISRGKTNGGFVYFAGDYVGESVSNASISAFLDTLTINSETFRNVIKMEVEKDSYIEDNQFLYYVDSVGVVKKEIIKSSGAIEAWTLTNRNVIMYSY